jgi:hypothetical protein
MQHPEAETQAAAARWRRPIIGGGFHLEQSPRAQALIAAMLTGAAYFLYEQLASEHRYAGDAAGVLLALAALGLAAALLGGWWLARGGVPRKEGAGVALAFAAAFVAAGYWGALRLNAWTDADGATHYVYVKQQGPRWTPRESGPPPLEFDTDLAYWGDFAPGREHEFTLYRGALGFWQLDLGPIREDQRRWREFWSSIQGPPTGGGT